MQTNLRGPFLLLGIGLILAGCVVPEPGTEGRKIGRYRFEAEGAGFVVLESESWLSRLVEAVFGHSPEPKLRVGAFADRGDRAERNSLRPEQIGQPIVRKRKLKGPDAKPTAMQRAWEVRLLSPAEETLAPFFYFKAKGEAESFAAEIQQRVSALRGSGAG